MNGASGSALPAAWWLFWWLVGLLATGMLVAWFVGGSRRAYREPDAAVGATDGELPLGD